MLSTSQRLAGKLDEAIRESNLKQTDIATACGVTKQAVQGWLKTGRIAKNHLPKLADITGRPLAWWLAGEQTDEVVQPDENARVLTELRSWRMHASTRSQAVIDQLCALAQINALREEDWILIEQVAARLKSRS